MSGAIPTPKEMTGLRWSISRMVATHSAVTVLECYSVSRKKFKRFASASVVFLK